MQQALQRSSLVPSGFVVESAYFEGDKAVIAVRAWGSVGLCPSCGTVSRPMGEGDGLADRDHGERCHHRGTCRTTVDVRDDARRRGLVLRHVVDI